MKKQIIALVLILCVPLISRAARVAVTDSGTDFSHDWLKGHELINENEIAGNMVDDDRNGKVDDIVGWNFVDDYGQVFFPVHLASVDTKVFKFFEVISRIQAGTQTVEDKQFWKENVENLNAEQKKALLDKLNFYGQYAHSTHVSGIIISLSPDAKIMSNRVFPDTPPENNQEKSMVKTGVVDIFYKILAAMTNGIFANVGTYLGERQIDVANYSLGVSLEKIARMVLSAQGIKNPTPEQVSKETIRAAAQWTPAGEAWMKASPGTLFVIAAGNDGTDNDKLPTFPANVKLSNSIAVAATNSNSALASFSNYGKATVEVAAPGVAVLSSVPSLDHKQLLPLSGTSMAAPYVVGVAAHAKNINGKLMPSDLKQILMSTVDHKDWLKGYVISEGVVNPTRVYVAAEKSKTMSLNDAIKFARETVKDQPTAVSPRAGSELPVTEEMRNFANALVF